MLDKEFEILFDSGVVLEAAVAPPIGVAPVAGFIRADFSREFNISKSVMVGC